MTLQEAIKHAREVSESECEECKREHEQLAEWLEELERLQNIAYGNWEWFDEENGNPLSGYDREWGWRCSCCKNTLSDEYDNPDSPPKFNFCPNCGAKMELYN